MRTTNLYFVVVPFQQSKLENLYLVPFMAYLFKFWPKALFTGWYGIIINFWGFILATTICVWVVETFSVSFVTPESMFCDNDLLYANIQESKQNICYWHQEESCLWELASVSAIWKVAQLLRMLYFINNLALLQ